eukprot:NODE_1662_length_778_cov_89.248848_g1613_i0.p1 GENE.NODE_1662_length_778_cov_89.248848_g1613_i0~~NODE_1662_length_778_cov_89.248848_g1613_i0.p1  ORF type:complete len:184 (+),score=36.36 NODE_1662_length_778_cov_89.248848_g1613_i0:144-695(+)
MCTRFLIVALFLLGAFARPIEDSKARLMVLKTVDKYDAVVHNNLTVSITVFNVGKSPAFEVEVDDSAAWAAHGVGLVEGEKKTVVDKINSGENVTHTYVVSPALSGELESQSTKVTYKFEPKGTEQRVVLSNTLPSLPVLTPAEYSRRNAKHYKEWFIFMLFGTLLVAVPWYVQKQALQALQR